MIEKEKKRNRNLAVLEILSSLWLGLNMVNDVLGLFPNQNYSLFLLIGFIVFAASIFWHLYSQNKVINSITPSVKIGNPYKEISSVPMLVESGIMGNESLSLLSFEVPVIRVDFVNNPDNPSDDNDARNVIAEMRYYDFSGHIIGKHHYGRWVGNEFPDSIDKIGNVLSTTIKSNRIPKVLELAVVIPKAFSKEDEWYVYSNETLYFEKIMKENRQEFFRLDNKVTTIKIDLRGNRIAEEYWIEIINGNPKLLSHKPSRIKT
jgi:hypothetical protein